MPLLDSSIIESDGELLISGTPVESGVSTMGVVDVEEESEENGIRKRYV